MRIFTLLLPPSPFPQSCPALVTPKSHEVTAALLVNTGVQGVWRLEGGAWDAAARGRGQGRAAAPEEERGPSPHLCLVNFQASSPTTGDAPEGCHVHQAEKGLWEQMCQPPGTRGSSQTGKSSSPSPRLSAPLVLSLPCL